MVSRLIKKSSLDKAGLWAQPLTWAKGPAAQKLAPGGPTADEQQLVEPPASSAVEADEAEQMARLKRLVRELTLQLAHDRERLLAELLPHLVRLAISVAHRIVEAEIRQDPRLVRHTVRAALEELGYTAGPQVRVHPDDEPAVRELLASDETLVATFGQPKVIADSNVERGGCVAECDRGIVDARIPIQFAELQKSLLACLEE